MEPAPRDLRAVAAAIAVSTMGDFVAAIALALQTNELWAGIGVSVIFIALWSPIVVLAGHAGLIVDRFETRTVAIAAALFQCVVAAALAFATGSITATLALAVLLGVGAAIGQSAEFALVPLLAGTRSLSRANGMVESARGLGFAVGPVIGGALAASVGTRWALLADSASFLLIAAALSSIAVRRRVSRAESAGFRARDDLGMSPLALGLVLTVWATAMILASILLAPRIPVHLIGLAALLAASAQGFSKFLAPFWMVFPFMCVCYLFGGLSHGTKNTLFRTLIHQQVAPARHGQAFAAYNGLRNGAELIALAAGGFLVAAIGGAGTLWLAGGAAGVVGLGGAVLLSTRGAGQTAAARANTS